MYPDQIEQSIKKWRAQLLNQEIRSLLAAGCATSTHPGQFPNELSELRIRPRTADKYRLLGATRSIFDEDHLVVGVSYEERKTLQDKEDLFVFDTKKQTARSYYRGMYQTVNPLYANTHHGSKDYLDSKTSREV